MATLAEVARRANEAHMTYGQYVAQFCAPAQTAVRDRRIEENIRRIRERKRPHCPVCGEVLIGGHRKYCGRVCYLKAIRNPGKYGGGEA